MAAPPHEKRLNQLVTEVSSLLGFPGAVTETDMPSATQVKAWIAQGQRYLASVLPPDAMPGLWRTLKPDDTDLYKGSRWGQGLDYVGRVYLPDGSRVISVRSHTYNALVRQVSNQDWSFKTTGGSLFQADTKNPVWRLVQIFAAIEDEADPDRNVEGFHVEFYPCDELDSVEITYIQVPSALDDNIHLGPPLFPLLVKYAIHMAHMADEDDNAAALALQSLEGSIQSIAAAHVNIHGSRPPMALSGTGSGTDRATNRRG